MAWFRFSLSHTTPELGRLLADMPGVTVRDRTVTAADNAAWLVERACQRTGVRYTSTISGADGVPLQSVADLCQYGLRDWVPGFLTEYQKDGILAMAHRCGHLWWAAGCLSGLTEIVVNRGGNARRMKLRDLVAKFNGAETRNPRTGKITRWDLSIPTYTQSVDEKTGYIVKNRIIAAVASGVKTTLHVVTARGGHIEATADHKFWTPSGWRKLGDLKVGDEIMVEEWPTKKDDAEKIRYREIDHMWNHPNAVRRESKRSDRPGVRKTARVPEHRLVIEAAMNGCTVPEFVGRIVLGLTEGITFLPKDIHVHHIDGNPLNNDPANLVSMSAEEHLRHHGTESGWKHVSAKAVPTKIVDLITFGEEETYDLTMADPHNSFVANGIVVHNSGKTAGAICWSLASPGATVLVTRAGVRRSHAREIERLTTHRAYVIESKEDAAGLEETDALFVVVGWEGLPDVLEHILRWRPANVIFDECFPGDTKIAVPGGTRRIDSMRPGDVVLSVDAQGKVCKRSVTRVIANRLRRKLVRVTHETGSFVCTENHKIWTEEDGYVEAGRLDVRHHLRVVRVGDGDSDSAADGSAAFLREIVQREVADSATAVQGGVVAGRQDIGGEGRTQGDVENARVSQDRVRSHDRIQPNGGSRDCGEDGGVEERQTLSRASWREWSRLDETAGASAGGVAFAGGGVFRWDTVRDENGDWRSTVLDRLGGAGEEAGDRSGRGLAQDEEGPQPGCPQGLDSRGSRVVGVASEELGCADELERDGSSYSVVFDLEVEGTHCYFANGTLVSNCHKAKSHKRFRATQQADGSKRFDALENIAQSAYRLSRACKRRLATTATPIKDRTRDLWAQLDLIHPDAWGPFYRMDRASFTGRYCAARPGNFGGINTEGSSNLDELWDRVSMVTHHVPHSITHRHLPPRRRIVTYVTPAEQCAATGFTQAFWKKVAPNGKNAILEARLMEAAGKKRKVLLDLVEEAVAGGQKVTIFTGRREDCEKLADEVSKLGCRVYTGHGGTAPRVRDQIQQQYMADRGPCVLVGTGDAWGEGVSLHDTDLALIAFLPYTPGAVVQWEGRFSRQGQKRPVLIQYLVAEGTVDEHVAEILLTKLQPVEAVSKDDSIEGFADALMGSDQEEEIIDSILGKLGVA